MEYPKRIMNRKELIKLGYSKTYLQRVYTTPGQKCAFKMMPNRSRSRILFDTEELEKFREKEIKAQQAAIRSLPQYDACRESGWESWKNKGRSI